MQRIKSKDELAKKEIAKPKQKSQESPIYGKSIVCILLQDRTQILLIFK